MTKTVKMYLHGDQESNYTQGEEIGLKGEELKMFSYALYEVAFDVEVDMATGEVKILKVDGKRVVEE